MDALRLGDVALAVWVIRAKKRVQTRVAMEVKTAAMADVLSGSPGLRVSGSPGLRVSGSPGLEASFHDFRASAEGSAARLLDQLAPLVLGWIIRARRQRRPWLGANDLTQEALIRIHEGLPGLRSSEVGGLLRWVWRVSANVVEDEYRRTKARRRSLTGRDPADPAEVVGREDPPDQAAARGEAIQWVGSLLSALSPQHEQVLRLRAEGRDFDEVASVMALPSSNAAECLHRRAMVALHEGQARRRERGCGAPS